MPRKKKIIIGAVTGAVAGIMMDVLRGSSYMAGVSVTTKAVIAGIMAGLIYLLISEIVKLARSAGATKA